MTRSANSKEERAMVLASLNVDETSKRAFIDAAFRNNDGPWCEAIADHLQGKLNPQTASALLGVFNRTVLMPSEPEDGKLPYLFYALDANDQTLQSLHRILDDFIASKPANAQHFQGLAHLACLLDRPDQLIALNALGVDLSAKIPMDLMGDQVSADFMHHKDADYENVLSPERNGDVEAFVSPTLVAMQWSSAACLNVLMEKGLAHLGDLARLEDKYSEESRSISSELFHQFFPPRGHPWSHQKVMEHAFENVPSLRDDMQDKSQTIAAQPMQKAFEGHENKDLFFTGFEPLLQVFNDMEILPFGKNTCLASAIESNNWRLASLWSSLQTASDPTPPSLSRYVVDAVENAKLKSAQSCLQETLFTLLNTSDSNPMLSSLLEPLVLPHTNDSLRSAIQPFQALASVNCLPMFDRAVELGYDFLAPVDWKKNANAMEQLKDTNPEVAAAIVAMQARQHVRQWMDTASTERPKP